MRKIVAWFMLLFAVPVYAASVTLEVAPKIGRSPQDIHIIAKIEPSGENRAACVVIEGPKASSSCWELTAGDRRTWELWRKGFPGGRYTVALEVEDRMGKITHRETGLCVVGGVREGEVDCGGSGGVEISTEPGQD